MSDTDVDYGPDDPSDLILRDQRQTMSTAMASLEDDPQKVARSFELGEATGDHPAVIYSNLENYENQHKAALTAQLLNSSKFLRQYVDADPMHAKLSNDDYGNLDAVSSAVSKFSSTRAGQIFRAPEAVGGGIFEGAMEGFKKGWDNVTNPAHIKDQEIKDYPLFTALMQSARFPVDVGAALISAGTEAIKGGTKAGYQVFTGDEQGAERFSREMAGMAETVLTNTSGYHGIHAPTPAQLEKVHGILDRAKPWLDDGKEPPRGLDPEIDKLKFEQNKIDVDNLDEAFKASQSSATRERNPDIFAGFIRQHTDAKIGVSGEAVAKLYGDKVPDASDGLLGFVPGLAEELESAKATGGDVHIPLADWLAKVDPEVAKALHDDIRVRPGGITKIEKDAFAEAKEGIEGYKPAEPIPEPLPSVRAASALEPLFSVGDRKLELKRGQQIEGARFGPSEGFHDFQLLDENGQQVGSLNLSEAQGGKQLYIEMIQAGHNYYNPNSMGPALMRDLLRQLKAEFPEAETITGHRVSGAREKAESYMKPSASPVIKLDADLESVQGLREILAQWEPVAQGLEAKVRPTELYGKYSQRLIDATNEELDRIAPTAIPRPVEGLRKEGDNRSIRGAYIQYRNSSPEILYSLASGDTVGIARHEAIHHLRREGFFKEDEWDTLSRAARDESWVEKFGIDKRYPDLENSAKLEEAIADGYRAWAKNPKDVAERLHPIFEKLKQFIDAIKARFKEIIGHEPTWEELFGKVESGEVGRREGNVPLDPNAYREALSVEGEQPEAPFGKGAIMPVAQQKLYDKLIQQRHEADLAASISRAEAEQRKRQTKEWKANEKEVRQQVEEGINSRPDIAADLYFSSGELFGQRGARPKLDAAKLTEEQKARLPKDYCAKSGFDPDDIGNLFGYPTGDAMVAKLGDLNEAKIATGLNAKAFSERLVGMETERQMQAKYGNLEQSILEHAEEQAISENQLNILHEETLKLGMDAGLEFSISKGDLKAAIKEQFDKQPIGSHSFAEYMANVGKAGKAVELALLRGDAQEAYRQAQRKQIAFMYAQEAKGLEKAEAQFDKIAKRYQKREVAGASPEYTDAVHDILMRLGNRVNRSIQDLQESYRRNGYDDLKDFVDNKQAQLRDLHTPDFLQDPNFRKPLNELTVEEFQQVHNAVKAITHNSRDELKVIKAGEKHDLEEVLGEMIEKMQSLGDPKQHPIDGSQSRVGETVKSWWWSGINVESMMNRLDRDNPSGVFYQCITHHFTEASNYKERLIKEYQGKISKLGKIEGMDKQVENTLFKDPLTDQPFLMRRRNVLGILQQAGNENNLTKLAKGYGLENQEVLDWLHRNTTKEDWDRAQAIGNLFNEIFDMADVMSHNISGVGIQKLPLRPIETPHGTYDGWYNPIKYDPLRPGTSKKLMGPQAIEEEGFYRATTPQGYTKQRTGYIAPVELNLDIVPTRMKQMLHDIAMRPAILQISKFFYDNRFERAMTAYYGAHQAKEMIPFLKDIANAPNFKSMSEQLGNEALEYCRQNTIATLIGFNPGTVMKHGATAWINSMTEVGSLNYLREFKNIVAETATGRDTWREAMEKSEELQRRMRNYSELFSGHGSEINIRGARSNFMSLRDMVMSTGATPVSISDLLSAVPTWAAKYKTEIANGTDEGMAVSLANRAVRNAHGSSTLSNKPSIARTNALGAMFSSLYGFFSHMQQKQYALAWKARDMLQGQRTVPETAPDLIRGLFSYIIAPAIIEELVTPTTNDEHESWGKKAATTLAMGVSSSFIGVRDFVRAAINVRDPQAGLIGTSLKAGTDVIRDLSKGPQAFTKEKAGNLIKHTFALTGVLTGLTNAQEGKTAEYMYNYFQGKEKPKGPWDVGVGMRYGSTDKHSRTFDQWLKHH